MSGISPTNPLPPPSSSPDGQNLTQYGIALRASLVSVRDRISDLLASPPLLQDPNFLKATAESINALNASVQKGEFLNSSTAPTNPLAEQLKDALTVAGNVLTSGVYVD